MKKDGKTVKEALDEWLKKHPEDSNSLNAEDTVQKAIKKVDDLMKPVSELSQVDDDCDKSKPSL